MCPLCGFVTFTNDQEYVCMCGRKMTRTQQRAVCPNPGIMGIGGRPDARRISEELV